MSILFRIAGAILILAAVQDVFHTLFHPAKQGALSDWIASKVWRIVRSTSPKSMNFAGPLAFVTIVLYWALSIIVGFGLIYLPALPNSFVYVTGTPSISFLSAIDLSIGSLITLSTGTYSKSPWLALIMGIESIMGFALLTASVSWILSIYPVLEHRKSFAREATLLRSWEAQGIGRLEQVGDSDLQEILLGLASQLITGRNELMQFPITYYFHEDAPETSLAGILPYLADIADRTLPLGGSAAIGAITLAGAVEDYLKLIADIFLNRDFKDREELLRAFAEDHRRPFLGSPKPWPRAA